MGFRARQLKRAADRFFRGEPLATAPALLPELLDRAAAHLQDRLGASAGAARKAALAAWSELEGERTGCYIDLKASSAQLLYLVDPIAGTRRPIPVVDLVRMLGPRIAAA